MWENVGYKHLSQLQLWVDMVWHTLQQFDVTSLYDNTIVILLLLQL